MKIFLTCFALSVLLISGCSQKMAEQDILARFDKQVVTKSELEKEISELPEWKQDKYKDQSGREEYLTLMAESRMILQIAKERKLDKNPEIIKEVNDFQDQLIRDAIVKREVDDKVKITDADLEKYYAENKEKYIEPEKVAVTEITLKEESKAKELMEKIKSGEDFTALAKEMDSKGESFGPGSGNEGKTRPFSRDSYSSAKEFVEKAFSLQPGEMSDIIVQPMGKDTFYMIIRLDEHNPPRQKEFSEVKDDIQNTLEKEKKDERKKQWIEGIKKDKKYQLFADKIKEPVKATEGSEQKEEKPSEEGSKESSEEVE